MGCSIPQRYSYPQRGSLERMNDAQNDGRWNGSINPTDLQGWSTDSSVEGTRG